MARSSSIDLPVAPGIGQSSALSFAPIGHRSRQPNVTTREAAAISSGVAVRGVLGPSRIPISANRSTTTGLMAVAACTPALSARHPGDGAALNRASDNTLRKVFSTQTNRTRPTEVSRVRQPNRFASRPPRRENVYVARGHWREIAGTELGAWPRRELTME